MNKIKILPKHLANKIAAGEVVERPASVVKELIENSLDAKSTNIEIRIENAGQAMIKVTDDGAGMSAEDLKLAPLRHATSKIEPTSDLTCIRTLGFRGEALSSIAAVSFLKIASAQGAQSKAVSLEVEGGIFKNIHEAARVKGTTVEVRNLFFNTPARLKFLKSKATESAHITRSVIELALSHPEVAVKLIHNQEEIINCNIHSDLLDRIKVLFGEKLGKELIPISFEIAPLKIKGFISKPGCGQSNRRNQYVFVNNRPVTDKTINHAIIQGYRTYLIDRQFPCIFLFIETPYELVDVNVHPGKREVRFREAAVLHDVLVKLIKDALTDKRRFPSGIAKETTDAGNNEGRFFGLKQMTLPNKNVQDFRKELFSKGTFCGKVISSSINKFQSPLPHQTVYLQVKNTYIVSQDENGLVIIDQHAAHERVLFDKLMQGFKQKKIEKQKLLLPVTMHLSKDEFLLAREQVDLFNGLGFEIAEFGGQTVAVHSYPALLGKIDISCEFKNIIADMLELDIAGDINKRAAEVLATVACHCAIRANEVLTQEQMQALMAGLYQTNSPYTCPHGRPTMITKSWNELEKEFKRK